RLSVTPCKKSAFRSASSCRSASAIAASRRFPAASWVGRGRFLTALELLAQPGRRTLQGRHDTLRRTGVDRGNSSITLLDGFRSALAQGSIQCMLPFHDFGRDAYAFAR